MAEQPQETDAVGPVLTPAEPVETPAPDPTAAHRSSQRRLLFAIELTLFALVLVVASPGSPQAGVLLAGLGLFVGLSGL
jgi:hypothetical protein